MTDATIKLGWEEWLSLPDLNLPAIKAKIDTGARTSALHAVGIEPFGTEANPKVRFTVYPIPENYEVAIPCSAPVKDRREVTSSNGETELRFVIETHLQFGDQSWPIEVTLTDRTGMAYHMLLGRRALVDRCVVVPGESHQQPDLGYDAYATKPIYTVKPRSLRIALLTAKPNTPSSHALIEEAEVRGHVIEQFDPAKLSITTSLNAPRIQHGSNKLPHFDAVIPRMPVTRYNAALLRQFDMLGAYTINSAEGLTAAHDPVLVQQKLVRNHIAVPELTFPAISAHDLPADAIEVLVTGGKLTVITRDGKRSLKLTKDERRTALRAARVFKLGFAALSLLRTAEGLQVLTLTSRPNLTHIEKVTRKNPASALFDLIEKQARPRPHKPKRKR
ncbi:RimK/LysX family protein [uncultured Litoreibacter sp.]|uniref:putative ATP-dependent zinc protease n=1 Tax=uncultured Litoreibacter sp. TaxID=1392394 RepID=UPI0026342F02|nr:RimK/LysX family protein [uncultured Litoreibacter sp.]